MQYYSFIADKIKSYKKKNQIEPREYSKDNSIE